jgi:hypothetical protein
MFLSAECSRMADTLDAFHQELQARYNAMMDRLADPVTGEPPLKKYRPGPGPSP